MQLWRDLASRPPSLDARRLAVAAGLLDLSRRCRRTLAESLSEQSRAGDPVSAAAKAAALISAAVPDAPAAEAEILALWAFDIVLALRLRWPRPVPLIATKILDPSCRSDGGGRPRPGDPAWPKRRRQRDRPGRRLGPRPRRRPCPPRRHPHCRRAQTARQTGPKIVDLLLAQDCVSPAEAARHAPMTGRAARRLFDRLVVLGAVRELSGRPAFRLYGL